MLKLKKILSAVSAFAIALTAFASMAVVEAADEPTIYTVLEKKNFSDSPDYDGYTQYVLTVKAEGINELTAFTTSGVGANKKYTGAGAKMINLNLIFDETKVGMCEINPLVTGGSVTKNEATGQFLWTTTNIAEYIQTPAFDIVEIGFVSIADADWNPATEDYTSNPITLATGAQSLAYGKFAGQKPAEGSTITLANGTNTLKIVDGTYGAKRADTYTKAFDVITIDSSYTKPFVRATVGTESKDYYLPSDVKGATKVQPFFKYNSADIDAGVTVTFDLGNRGSEDLVNVGSIVTE